MGKYGLEKISVYRHFLYKVELTQFINLIMQSTILIVDFTHVSRGS